MGGEILDKYRLEYEIKRRGLVKVDVQQAIGLSRTAFYRKCNGITDFTLSEVRAIADFLGLSPDDILDIFFAKKDS